MALIQDIDQFRAHVTLNSTSNADTYAALLPDMLLMEDEHIRPLLGDEFYQELDALAQVPAGLDDTQSRLLHLLQSALGSLTMVSYLDLAQVQISGSGVQIISNADQKTAFQWQIEALKVNWSRKGYNGLEKVLAYLEQHGADFPAWTGSEAARRHRELILSSATQFSKHYNISNGRLTYLALESLIRKTETFALEPAIGTDFFDEVKQQLAEGTLTAENKALVEKYLEPALAHLTMAQAIGELGFSLNGNSLELNIYRPDNSNSKESDPGLQKLLDMKESQALEDGERFLRRLRKHLNETASATRYATYFNSSAYELPAGAETYTTATSSPVYEAF